MEREGKELDDPHGAEIRSEVEEAMRDQLMLDVLAEKFNTQADQNELFNFLIEQAQAYGMDPNQFIQAAAQSNQLSAFAGELTRGKALISALRLAKVVDGDGNELNVADVVGEAPEGEIVPDFSAAPAPKAATTAGAEEAAPSEAAELFDPSTAKVDEVIAYVAGADDAERARVLEAEKAGKARKTLIEKLSA